MPRPHYTPIPDDLPDEWDDEWTRVERDGFSYTHAWDHDLSRGRYKRVRDLQVYDLLRELPESQRRDLAYHNDDRRRGPAEPLPEPPD